MKTGYLIDMDGVIYRENHLIPGVPEFIRSLMATGAPFLFLTNNSAPTPEDLAVRLKHLGITGLSARHFYTSALNTADFLCETDPGCTVFVIGEGGLLAALHERKMAELARGEPEQVVMIGDTMETDIRGAFEAGMQSYLVLSGSTQFEDVADYVYQPTRVLRRVADLTEEVRTGKPANVPGGMEAGHHGFRSSKAGLRHQTDIFALHKPRPR